MNGGENETNIYSDAKIQVKSFIFEKAWVYKLTVLISQTNGND